ncbi:hypothetical protein IAQ61_007878 [Plenodomus lingam]|uniref:uncharacterized protein n=1 Tax=Leptosphaeria maculans TaxID=5022 RepID=UPI0033305BB3|nr:hypothetical protein IAQ61_007878 [Plenodomus lingam]
MTRSVKDKHHVLVLSSSVDQPKYSQQPNLPSLNPRRHYPTLKSTTDILYHPIPVTLELSACLDSTDKRMKGFV